MDVLEELIDVERQQVAVEEQEQVAHHVIRHRWPVGGFSVLGVPETILELLEGCFEWLRLAAPVCGLWGCSAFSWRFRPSYKVDLLALPT